MSTSYDLLSKQLHKLIKLHEINDDALKETIRIVEEEGLTDAEAISKFLCKGIADMRTRDPRYNSPPPISMKQLNEYDTQTNCLPPKHREMRIPVLYSGRLVEPKDILQITDRALHYHLAFGDDFLYLAAFDFFHEATAYGRSFALLNAVNAPSQSRLNLANNNDFGVTYVAGGDSNCPGDAERPSASAILFEDINYRGETFELPYKAGIADLRDWTRHRFIFFETSDWNDSISSIRVGDATVVAYEHINYQGSTLSLFGSTPMPNFKNVTCKNSGIWQTKKIIDSWTRGTVNDVPRLTEIGWNDRISSIMHVSYF